MVEGRAQVGLLGMFSSGCGQPMQVMAVLIVEMMHDLKISVLKFETSSATI